MDMSSRQPRSIAASQDAGHNPTRGVISAVLLGAALWMGLIIALRWLLG
jgi:hypothetical protein